MRASWMGLAIIAILGADLPAQSKPAELKPPQSPKKGDSSEIVCEKIESIGSRVATKKVCGTRAEWAEKRKLDREAVDQAQRAANGPCQTVNTHSGAPSC